jgi:hypothetical protein
MSSVPVLCGGHASPQYVKERFYKISQPAREQFRGLLPSCLALAQANRHTWTAPPPQLFTNSIFRFSPSKFFILPQKKYTAIHEQRRVYPYSYSQVVAVPTVIRRRLFAKRSETYDLPFYPLAQQPPHPSATRVSPAANS